MIQLRLTLFFLIFCLNNANACTCVTGVDTKYAYQKADIVVKAIVIESKNDDVIEKISDSIYKYTFSPTTEFKAIVLKKYKGTILGDTITIKTSSQSSACGVYFSNNKEYIIYARFDDSPNTFFTTTCAGTKLYSNNEHTYLLKLSRKKKK